MFTSAVLATLIGLGTWQLQRKAWKEALIDTLEVRLAAAAGRSAAARALVNASIRRPMNTAG